MKNLMMALKKKKRRYDYKMEIFEMAYSVRFLFNPIALRITKMSFGCSECNRVKKLFGKFGLAIHKCFKIVFCEIL